MIDFRQSFAQVRRGGVRPPRGIPYVVLSKTEPFGIPGALGRAVERAWVRGGDYLAGLRAGTPHLYARGSGHYIQVEDPELVIASVGRVLDAVRRGSAFTGRVEAGRP